MISSEVGITVCPKAEKPKRSRKKKSLILLNIARFYGTNVTSKKYTMQINVEKNSIKTYVYTTTSNFEIFFYS